ncbi:threonine-phosphate decarboxylase CobD [Chlorobaculum sp. MV4-Y]|jgi:L-threonine-O-3-phosphate decarboxylase|uniref:threonine-phosphate decarboxylase CobD n=1 Tax=Chlorobaculum sp. MV4-Y TaxID=2976335 RepID=UPI0021B07B4C|nr:threonine-phosphate decarboxylase CobD [Chlorobaculum sp. MV4-Y]UWX58407.1 threonine-phosphate decarboxylase CobD [Chlorobaculum sp. MV4-Y]
MNRDHLLAHRHGDRTGKLAKGGVLDFSVNLAPVEPPIRELSTSIPLAPYPTMDGRGVRDFYAARFGLDPDCVLATNGAIEGIYLAPRALGLRRVLIPQPSFFDYGRACRLVGAEVVPLALNEADGFAFPGIDALSTALAGCDAMIAGSPNNPTGTLIPKEKLFALACRFPDKTFIIDEAFIQFTEAFPMNSLMPEIRAFRNIVVIYSLTKFYAIAGLRLGAIVAHPTTIRQLYGYKEPWTVNAVAEHVAGQLLYCRDYEREVCAIVAEGRQQISDSLAQNSAITLYGGLANFFFASVNDGVSFDALLGFLAERGILVRDCRNFEGVSPTFFRFCIRASDENRRLISALNDFSKSSQNAKTAVREAVR